MTSVGALAAFHILRGFGLFIDPQAYMDAR